MSEITVIGSFVMDMIASVDRFAQDGDTLIAKDFVMACGGKGVNQAVAVKRLGHDVEMIGVVGDDKYGKTFLDMLASEKIAHEHVFVSKSHATGMAHIQINSECQNRIVVIPGANNDFLPEYLDAIQDVLRKTKIVMVQFELPIEITKQILIKAKEYGAITILNPAPARCIDIEVLKNADYITPNDLELAALTGMPTDTVAQAIAAARWLHQKGVRNVIATLGGKGALAVNDKIETVVPVFPVSVADTVGAGDSFNGALAVKLSEGADLTEALQFANAEGALTVTKTGAIPALHTRAEVDSFLKLRLASVANWNG